MTAALIVSILAAVAACAAAAFAVITLRRTQATAKSLDSEIERG